MVSETITLPAGGDGCPDDISVDFTSQYRGDGTLEKVLYGDINIAEKASSKQPYDNGNCHKNLDFTVVLTTDQQNIRTITVNVEGKTNVQNGNLVPVVIETLDSTPSTQSSTSATGTTSTVTPSPPPPSNGNSNAGDGTVNGNSGNGGGLGSGAVAGVAIGCLLAGIAVGALLVFLFMKKRMARRNLHAVPITTPQQSYHAAPPSDSPQLNQFLLDATPDREIASELRSLRDLIQQHVENHYHLQPIQANPAALAKVLADLGVGTNGTLSPDDLAALALNPSTRQPAIQHVLSEVLFSAVAFNSASHLSMLPAPVASFMQSVPPVERKTGDTEATNLALTKWRTLTAFLLHPIRSQRTPLTPNESTLTPQVQALSTALNAFLEPFVVPDHNSRYQQTNHLQDVIMECTKLGYVVFSQPGEWAFVHRPDGAAGACLVTCAGVEKVRNKDGVGYGGGQVVEQPVVVQL